MPEGFACAEPTANPVHHPDDERGPSSNGPPEVTTVPRILRYHISTNTIYFVRQPLTGRDSHAAPQLWRFGYITRLFPNSSRTFLLEPGSNITEDSDFGSAEIGGVERWSAGKLPRSISEHLSPYLSLA